MIVMEYQWVDAPWAGRVNDVLRSWEGTRYMIGQKCKGRYVDCVGFVTAVLDELSGGAPIERSKVPGDTALHTPEKSHAALKEILQHYGGHTVTDGTLEPGDVVWTGPRSGGPGHGLVVSGTEGVLYHAPGPGKRIQTSGFAYLPNQQRLHVLRPSGKGTWL